MQLIKLLLSLLICRTYSKIKDLHSEYCLTLCFQTERQTDRQTDRQSARQSDRLIDRFNNNIDGRDRNPHKRRKVGSSASAPRPIATVSRTPL